MMGRAHALSGVALCLALIAAALLTAVYSVPTSMALFLAAICGGAAVLPDIDHPDATVSQVFGPATWILSKVVNGVSGGHRNGTHSALGCALLAMVAFGATALHTGNPDTAMQGLLCGGVLLVTTLPVLFLVGPTDQRCYKSEWGGLAAVSFMVLLGLAAVVASLAFGRIVGTVVLGVLLLLALSALARAMRIPGKWDEAAAAVAAYLAVAPDPYRFHLPAMDLALVPWALTVGAVIHCWGDAITKGGVPWAWPLTQADVGLKWIVTNGPTERRVLVPLFVVAIGCGIAVLVNPAVGFLCGLSLAWLIAQASDGRKKSSGKRKAGGKRPARKPAAKKPATRRRTTARTGGRSR